MCEMRTRSDRRRRTAQNWLASTKKVQNCGQLFSTHKSKQPTFRRSLPAPAAVFTVPRGGEGYAARPPPMYRFYSQRTFFGIAILFEFAVQKVVYSHK